MNRRSRFGPTSRKVWPQRAHKSNWQSNRGSVWQTDRRRLRVADTQEQASKSIVRQRGGRQSKQNLRKQLNWSARYRGWETSPPPSSLFNLHLLPLSFFKQAIMQGLQKAGLTSWPQALFLFGFVNRFFSGPRHQIWNRNCSLISHETAGPIRTAHSIMQSVFQWAHHKFCLSCSLIPKLKEWGLPHRSWLKVFLWSLLSPTASVIPSKNWKFNFSPVMGVFAFLSLSRL